MKKIFLLLFCCWNGMLLFSQNQINVDQTTKPGKHRIVFQLTTGDTAIHRMMLKNLNNVLTVAPDSELEVVCHGPGISILMKAQTALHDKISQLSKRGVRFNACEFTMKDKNLSKSDIIEEAGYVQSGVIEIVKKQEQGWSYLRATN